MFPSVHEHRACSVSFCFVCKNGKVQFKPNQHVLQFYGFFWNEFILIVFQVNSLRTFQLLRTAVQVVTVSGSNSWRPKHFVKNCLIWFLMAVIQHVKSSTIYPNIQILSKGKVYSAVFIFEMYLCWYWRLNRVDTLQCVNEFVWVCKHTWSVCRIVFSEWYFNHYK